MSSQRYFQPERCMPADGRQRPRRSPPRYAGDWGKDAGYGFGSQHRATDMQPRFDDSRDRGFAPRGGPPRGPRAAVFDAPKGRMTDSVPRSRGRQFGPRGDFRAAQWGAYREGNRALEEPSNIRPSDPWNGNRRGTRDFGVRRDSGPRSPPPRPFPDTHDYRHAQPAVYETSRDRDSHDLFQEQVTERGRGRGQFRNDWTARGRGRCASHGADAARCRSSDRSPMHERRWDQDGSQVSPHGDSRDDAYFQRRRRDSMSRAEEPAQVFDPFTQDRAAARDSIYGAKPTPPLRPPSRPQVEHREYDRAINHGWRPPLPSTDKQNHEYSQPSAQSHRESSKSDRNLHSRHGPAHIVTRTPEASSPPQPPPVPAFGSTPPAHVPQGPKTTIQESRFPKAPPTAPTAPRSARIADGLHTQPTAEPSREPPKAPKAARMQGVASTTEKQPFESPNNDRQNLHASHVGTEPPRPSVSQPPSNAPKGPTAGTQPTSQQVLPSPSVPSGPRGALTKTNSSQQYSPAFVPTGPKANRMPGAIHPPPPPPPPAPKVPTAPASGPAWKPHWQASTGSGRGPTVPAKRDVHGIQIARGSPAIPPNNFDAESHGHDSTHPRDKDRQAFSSLQKPKSDVPSRFRSPPKSPAWGDEPPEFEVVIEKEEARRSSQERSEDGNEATEGQDDLMELDEADFESKEAQFNKDKAKLEEEKIDLSSRRLRGATPMDRLAFLSELSILILPEPDEPPAMSQGDDDSEDRMQPSTPEQRALDEVNRTDKFWSSGPPELDLTTEDDMLWLPYLHRSNGTTLQEQLFYKTNVTRLQEDQQDMLDRVTLAILPHDPEEDRIRQEYYEVYDQWKDRVEELDQLDPVDNPDGDEPFEQVSYPLLDAPPMQLSTAGRRGGAVNGFDLERVLQESLQTANQEEDKRKRLQASARFDPLKEVCPPALGDESGALRPVFVDTRDRCKDSETRVAYNLEPDLDEFTEEEHERMVTAFTQWSKRWGRLALDVGGDRSYKECINHYYSSKWRGEFKDQRDKRRQRSKPGRMRSSQILGGRPKANALISNLGDSRMDLYEGSEFSMPSMAVTDSGRPRRAAAPSFGTKETDELLIPPPSTGRRGARSVLTGEIPQERPARKTRGAARERGQRRPRNQVLPRDATLSPEKLEMPTSTPHSFASYDVQGSTIPFSTHLKADGTYAHDVPTSPEAIRNGFIPTSGVQQEDPGRNGGQTRKSGMSSYWSVHETEQFIALVRQLGSDWEEIAHRIGTKTPVMVKNLFKRKIAQNAVPGLEDDLRRADDLRNQPHMFGIGGLNDPGQDGSPIRHTALHRPMEELRRVPVGSEGHAAQRSEHQNPPLLSTLRSSVNSIRQDMAFDDQVSRPARLLHQSEEAAQRNVHDDAHTRFHPGTGSNLSPRLRPASVAQHPMPAWNSQALPISELPQPVSYDDRQRSINQSPDHARRQLFEENRALRERDCGPGRPASPPYARFDRQHREWLSDRGPFVTNSNLANAHESGNNSQTLSPYPRQDRSIQTGAQREPRKQSNILSILNAEPDEPSSRAPPPRTHTPPYRHDSMPDHSRPVSHTVRHDRAGHQNADLHGSVSTNVDMGSSFAPKPSQAFTTGTDSSSRLISGDGRPRQPFEYPGRSSSADLHYQVARNSQTRTPPGVLGFGSGVGNNFAESSSLKPHARAIERPHSGMHAERASERQAYVPEPGNGMYQERHPSISFNASRDTRGLRGHDLSKGPSSTAMRSADDFLLNGSGTYRGRSAQFDRHLSQRQAPPPLPPAEYRTSDPKSDSGGSQTNPFMHPESRAPLQRHFPEQYRPPSTTFGGQYPSEPRSIMGFGRIGPAQQQSAGMPQSQDNEPSKTRPP